MNADERRILLAIQHVPWEGPHRILEAWLTVPEMTREARRALGDAGAAALPAQAEAAEADLIARTTPGLRAFADLVRANRASH